MHLYEEKIYTVCHMLSFLKRFFFVQFQLINPLKILVSIVTLYEKYIHTLLSTNIKNPYIDWNCCRILFSYAPKETFPPQDAPLYVDQQ